MTSAFEPVLAARVVDEREAAACLAAELSVIFHIGPDDEPDFELPFDRAPDDAGEDRPLVEISEVGTLSVWVDGVPSMADLDREAAAGHAGCLLVGDAARVLDARPMAALVALTADAAARGLRVGVAGSVEPPDVPRLLALGVSVVVAGGALRHGPDGTLDRERMAAMRAQMQAVAAPPSTEPMGLDRIFVRDFVVTMGVGAYGWERGAPQRVRFDVEADLAAAPGAGHGMADVVSYDLITDAIQALAGGGHVDLVETLAEAVARAVLAHPRVQSVRVRVEKLDLGPHVVGVEITRARAAGA